MKFKMNLQMLFLFGSDRSTVNSRFDDQHTAKLISMNRAIISKENLYSLFFYPKILILF